MKLKNYFFAIIVILNIVIFSKTIYSQPVLETPANNTLDYDYAKVTYTWDSVTSATVYDLQVVNDTTGNATFSKSYTNLAVLSYTPSTDYLSYGTKFYWRVRAKVSGTYTEYSDYFTFTTGTPSNSIGSDPNASITFDHTTGTVTQLVFKNGSNGQLLNQALNDKNKIGLGRISGETGTKLASWSELAGNYQYTYENSTYGSKTLTITWSATGIVVDIAINLAASKSAVLNAAWMPGGDLGPLHDYVFYAPTTTQLIKTNLTYPGISSTLFSDTTYMTAMTDDRYPEYFGFKTATPAQNTVIQQSLSFGPAYTYASATTAQSLNLTFAVMNKSNFFTWSGNKYVIVSAPLAGVSLLDQSSQTIAWESFGTSGTMNIKLSTDGGTTFPRTLASGVPDTGSSTVTLPNLSASVPLKNCVIQVSAGTTNGVSGIFNIVSKSSEVFSIASGLTGSPGDTVLVPIIIKPHAGDSLYAFDIRLFYNKDVLSYSKSYTDPSLANWNVDVTNSATGGYIQIGAFNNTGSPITVNDTLVVLKLSIKSTAKVGLKTPLTINNTYLSAANASAQTMYTSGVDSYITLYSRISGYLRYIVSKKPITGSSMVGFVDYITSTSKIGGTNTGGYFSFANEMPGDSISIIPIANLNYPATITSAINAVDAAKAFAGRDGGPTTLSPLQCIVADVNGDGKVNSIDAYAILKISTGALTEANFGLTNWVFVDSSYTLTASNWASAPQNKLYAPLDSTKDSQTFWGAIRGDVDGGYSLPTSLNKSGFELSSVDDSGILFSVPENTSVRPGDTLSLPLNVKLNGKTIGAFNTSFQIDKNLVTYAGIFKEGESIPSNKGWFISANFDSKGYFNVGATDFSDTLTPISKDGAIATFKFIVNNNAHNGDSSQIVLSNFSVADSKLNQLTATGKNGKIIVSSVSSTSNDNKIYEYKLQQNYPNPFNPSTTIEYSIKKQGMVEIEVYNAIGQKISTLFKGTQQAGNYIINWNAKNFASGIYFYRIKAGEFNQIKKMMLLK